MKINLWRGFHSHELLDLMKKCWQSNDLLILCPPSIKDLSFIASLPDGEVKFCGDWVEALHPFAEIKKDRPEMAGIFTEMPILGVFTSGTLSGKPKLVLYTKKNIDSSLNAILTLYDRSRLDGIFCYPQPFHTFGLLLGYVLSIKLNLPIYFLEGKYSQKAHELRVQMNQPGLMTLGTPTHFYDLQEFLRTTGQQINPSYTCIVGGAPVTVATWESLQKNLRISQPSIGYGCTEASPGIAHHPPGLKPKEDGEIGFPLSSLSSTPSASEGVLIQGSSLCHAMIDENKKLIFPTKLAVRDQIRVRSDGMWIYEGRMDLIINRGGQKISLEAVERSVMRDTGLTCIATAVQDARLGQDLALLIKGDANVPPEPTLVRNIQKAIYRDFDMTLRDSQIFLIAELPFNESLKLDRVFAKKYCEELRSKGTNRKVS